MIKSRQSYSDRRNKGRSGLYFIVGIVFLVAMFKWGMPAFINLLASEPNKTVGTKIASDGVPPQIPVLSALPMATNSAQIKIEGFTTANVDVKLFNNGESTDSTRSDDNGRFQFSLKLENGENKISVGAVNADGLESKSDENLVNYDVSEITLTIDNPKDGQEIFGRQNQNLEIKGKLNKNNVNLRVNGLMVPVDSSGNFSRTLKLNEGETKIDFNVLDQAGNSLNKSMTIKFSL